jgi:hypothetical protein
VLVQLWFLFLAILLHPAIRLLLGLAAFLAALLLNGVWTMLLGAAAIILLASLCVPSLNVWR